MGSAQLQEAAARGSTRLIRQQQQQQRDKAGSNTPCACTAVSTLCPAQLVPVALLDEQPFLQDLAAAIHAHNTQVLQLQLQQQSLSGRLSSTGQQLSSSGQQLQQQQHNPKHMQLIVPLLLQTVQRTAAAVAVQSAWRSHSSRIQQRIAERLLHNRAACAIQRAWRACACDGVALDAL